MVRSSMVVNFEAISMVKRMSGWQGSRDEAPGRHCLGGGGCSLVLGTTELKVTVT
jgi:hypothetical protein